VKNEVKKITGGVEKLVGATDDSAKKLINEIKTDIKNLVDKSQLRAIEMTGLHLPRYSRRSSDASGWLT
jgi:ElaB/YqjD/DUF883 family membrane-anchored ribosome-binding protein